MIDYLAELLDRAGDLLEAVRRTEGRLAAPLLGETDSALRRAVRRSTSLEAADEETAGQAQGTGSGPEQRKADLPEAEWPEERRGEIESPLLEQTLQLERALQTAERSGTVERSTGSAETGKWGGTFPFALPGSGGRNGFPGVLAEGSAGRPAGLAAEAAAPGTAEENWAEQTDRVFRRDSRRYDSGFYLY